MVAISANAINHCIPCEFRRAYACVNEMFHGRLQRVDHTTAIGSTVRVYHSTSIDAVSIRSLLGGGGCGGVTHF
jgi:hypothetical protein